MSRALTAARIDGNERDFQRETPAMSATTSAARRLAVPLALGGATALLHLLTANDGWDLFRDELYYIANGRRPSLGYVDHPPMIGWLTWAVLTLLGDSKLAATYRCLECMPYEAEKEIWVARGLRWPLAEMWPQVKSFG